MSCKSGTRLADRIGRLEDADERREQRRRDDNQAAMARVDLEAARRDLIVADRPAMLVELARLASRSRSQFVLKSWRPV